eukprot:3867592-Pyramimonas_sp.AAC.1
MEDGPIIRRKQGYMCVMDQSYAGSEGTIFSQWTNRMPPAQVGAEVRALRLHLPRADPARRAHDVGGAPQRAVNQHGVQSVHHLAGCVLSVYALAYSV